MTIHGILNQDMRIKSIHSVLTVVSSAVIALISSVSLIQAEFTFNKNDHICIVGNALPVRMQHDGWLETLLQSQNPDKNLVFRNLAFPGEMVHKRPRSRGFMTPEEYLKHCKADVIFVFFGYNESREGGKGLDNFRKNLSELVDSYRELKPNGESEPRIVLFSPITHEDLKDPNLPDGRQSNSILEFYTLAIKQVAMEKDVLFVDLFSSTRELFANAESPLTLNGIHLTVEGNRRLAEVIAGKLSDHPVQASASLEKTRQSVIDKNWHWFNRYRATDGNDVWGGRSGLKFTNDQTNREVLQNELTQLDVMTANRDAQIWARANGRDLEVDDSNVRGPVKVITNVGGGSKSSNAMKEGDLRYNSGEEGIKSMKIHKEFEVNLFADEKRFPELVNPVQMAVDPKGRLWVAAWKTYPKWEPLKEMDDRLLILPDDDGDGVADRVITFAKVHNPTGFEFWNGGVLVASQPDILFLKDTDGDDVADVRIVYLQGIGSADTHHAANAFVYGPDGGIYWQSGIFLVNNLESPYTSPLNTGSSGMFRFDPRRFTINYHANNSPNPHGVSFDYWGYHYASDGTGGRCYQVRPQKGGFKMHELLKKEVRPVAANGIVSSSHFPEEMQGNFLICNTIGFLGIKQYDLDRNSDNGHVWGEPAEDLVVSSDKNFRPSDIEFGADGALYISDWHNVIIGHMQHNVRDPNRDHAHGRIYRMTAKGRPLQKPVEIAGASLDQLMTTLEHPVNGIRYRTRIELSGRDTNEVIAAAERWIRNFDPEKKEDAHHLLEALWLHQQHNVRNPQLLAALLKSPEPHARQAAGTVQHHWYNVDATGGVEVRAVTAHVEKILSKPKPKSGIISDTKDLTVVRIGTVVEKMQYDIKAFTVKAGKRIKLTFANPDFMPHNIVFVQPKSADQIAMKAIQLGAQGFTKQFLPDDNRILAAGKLLDHNTEEVLEFTAPTKPGDYEYVCTFPGHHFLMRGIMKVRP